LKPHLSRVASLCLALFSGCLSLDATAKPKPLSERRSDTYYVVNGALTLSGVAAAGVESWVLGAHGPGFDLQAFAPDDSVRQNFSESAAAFSDKLRVLTVAAPLLLQMSQGFDLALGNAALVYAQAHSFTLFLTTTTKLVVRRPRPYTHARAARIQEFASSQGSDAYASFFSGHSSSAYTAAGVTAQLRVRAGRHYRTDIWTGSAVGIAVGALVPVLHGVDVARVHGSEYAVGGAALGVTMLLSEVVDFCNLLAFVGACRLPRDVRVPAGSGKSPQTGMPWFVVPAAFAGGAGLLVSGEL